MVAALLDLYDGPRSSFKTGDKMGRGFRYAHYVIYPDLCLAGYRPGYGPGLRLQLLLVADDPADLLHRRIGIRIDLGGAAGDNNFSLGIGPAGLADCLSGLALGFLGDGTGIDDDHILPPGTDKMFADYR